MVNEDTMTPPAVTVEGVNAPVRTIRPDQLLQLGQTLDKMFGQYASDRKLTELKWLRNLRQYLGVYDPEIERQLGVNRSKAYPRVTRVKCISVLSRIMNLMFPGNERNWQLNASPSADMSPDDVKQAVMDMIALHEKDGVQPEVTMEFVDAATQRMASARAEKLSTLIDDQLQEIGGDQTADYVSLNRKVAQSGIMYGVGVVTGPFVREESSTSWASDGQGGYAPQQIKRYKPQFDFLPIWDFYPDMSAKSLLDMDGYFIRKVLTRSQLRTLGNRSDFFKSQITTYLSMNTEGNYKPREFEQDLRTMGTKVNVNDQARQPQGKYEVIVWHGPVSGTMLRDAGVTVPDANIADEIDAEVWMVAGHVIKADMNPWAKLGVSVRTIHSFQFDEDDTSPIGNGLPNVVRDSQMSIAAATRMALDNASVTCGPIMELNTSLMRADQDVTALEAYKFFYRDDDGISAQFPAIRSVEVDGHLAELQSLITMFMGFADMETFVGPATGGDMSQAPSEPMRTAAGASMMRGDAALPFKDIVRNYDMFTQSMIMAMVQFNRKFNPGLAAEGDYDVIARGATSLIAKEVRGMQVDQLAVTMTPEDKDHIDERKFVEARFAVRDMQSFLVPPDEVERKRTARAQEAAKQQEQQSQMIAAEVRKTLAEAFKSITQGQKNISSADANNANIALDLLERGLNDVTGTETSQAAAH